MAIPKKIKSVLDELEKNGFESYLVGGCVRDLLMEKSPKDWDIATAASPEQIQKIFPQSFCNNDFGTVTIEDIEITPFRKEEEYLDKRHPDKIEWAKSIEEDLSRRDFTINAIARRKNRVIDPFGGLEDIEKGIIRAVRNPEDRFSEDALRMMRAVRFAVVLGFKIDFKTKKAIQKHSSNLKVISKERIRDEFLKIIMSERAAEGIDLLRELGLLSGVIPELEENIDISQNKHHIYDCYQHAVFSLGYAAKKGFNRHVRLAALLHDIAKPKTKRGRGKGATFYGHEVVGAKTTSQILKRLRFSKKDIEKVVRLVRYHLFYYNVDEVSESSVRRLLRKVGKENIEELLQLRMADRIGSGCPKAEPYKLRHLRYVIEKVSQDPISTKSLKISGKDIMDILKEKPGPKIGQILDILLGQVLSDPKKNTKKFLKQEIKKLGSLKDKELEKKSVESKKQRDSIETKRDEMTKQKYWVT